MFRQTMEGGNMIRLMKHNIDDITVSCLERTYLNTHFTDGIPPACLILTVYFVVVIIH